MYWRGGHKYGLDAMDAFCNLSFSYSDLTGFCDHPHLNSTILPPSPHPLSSKYSFGLVRIIQIQYIL